MSPLPEHGTVRRWLPAPGGRMVNTEAQAALVGEELERIERECGMASPFEIVRRAEPEGSPLHGFFDWDDDVAGARWRVAQARELVRSVRVVVITARGQAAVARRAFVSVVVGTDDPGNPCRGYMGIARVLSRADLRDQLLAQALADLRAFEAKYAELEELAGIFAALARLSRRRAGGKRR